MSAGSRLGVLLLHGKWDAPPFACGALAQALGAAGYPVRLPTLPWSVRRLYDRGFDAAVDEIRTTLEDLRDAEGCRRVVLCGHSLGAAVALAVGSRLDGIGGLALLAPGHFPERLHAAGTTVEALAAARTALEAGGDHRRIPLVDANLGVVRRLRIAPAAYLDWFSPDGALHWPRNAAAVRPGVPLLWVVGRADPARALGIDYAFTRAPADPLSAWHEIEADHAGTPTAAIPLILEWLQRIAERP